MHAAEGPPENILELLARLDRMSATMPKRLRQCAEYLRANINLVAATTVADMSSAAGVAPSKFVRYCQALGGNGSARLLADFVESGHKSLV